MVYKLVKTLLLLYLILVSGSEPCVWRFAYSMSSLDQTRVRYHSYRYLLVNCLCGPDVILYDGSRCRLNFDRDGDRDVDLYDVALLEREFNDDNVIHNP